MHKTELWFRLGVIMLTIVAAPPTIMPVINNIVNSTATSIADYIFLALFLAAIGLISFAWLSEFVSKPIKVISHQVHFESLPNNEQVEMSIYMTFLSNIAISLDKPVYLYVPKAMRQKLQGLVRFPIGFSLERYLIDSHIFLDQGRATIAKDSKPLYITINTETKALVEELCDSINNKLDYYIEYKISNKNYIYRPSKKEKMQRCGALYERL